MNKTMKYIKELQRKKVKGQKSVNVMGHRLDIDEAIGYLIDEENDRQHMNMIGANTISLLHLIEKGED